MSIFSSLTRNQKETAVLLQIGTFLEYFDLMLYVHMAVLLNELFFPKTDPHTASLLAAFAFCSTYVLRPFGALLFGYIGDNIGRKATVIITTAMMALSCIAMATLPTYAQIGIASAWMVTICRIFQGLSSMGEIVGAEIYLTEVTTPPARYPVVALIAAFSVLGGMCALAVSTFVVSTDSNWRLVFWIGASIAIFGSVARTKLRETKEFLEAKQKKNQKIKTQHIEQKFLNIKKTIIAYFLIFCPWPLYFYLSYIFCGNILKYQFGYTPEQVITQNLLVTVLDFITVIPLALLSYKIYPLKILKLRGYLNIFLIVLLPYALTSAKSPSLIFVVQVLSLTCGLSPHPGFAVFYIHFPVLKRFTYSTFLYALTRAIMYVVTSFGLLLITESFGYYGLWFLMVPLALGFAWSVRYFERLDNPTIHSLSQKG
ncbi:MAG TPA: MFS transporter [Holosporales bacterium]|nr:MFS transporter [Holosporales bacterium]